MSKIECAQCKREFLTRYNASLYCSSKCREIARNIDHPEINSYHTSLQALKKTLDAYYKLATKIVLLKQEIDDKYIELDAKITIIEAKIKSGELIDEPVDSHTKSTLSEIDDLLSLDDSDPLDELTEPEETKLNQPNELGDLLSDLE